MFTLTISGYLWLDIIKNKTKQLKKKPQTKELSSSFLLTNHQSR